MTASQQVWLVTGASSGFGVAIAEEALTSGHRVVATARNPSKAAAAHPQIEKLGGRWVQLDVTLPNTTEAVAQIIQDIGTIDVVVNNAGCMVVGSFEDLDMDEIHQQVNTNLYGPLRAMKAALPFFRAQRAGTIVNIGSIGGIQARPAFAGYSASKFGIEGLSECVAQEVAPFNVRVLLVEPGSFRTNFLASLQAPAAGMMPDYEGTAVDSALKSYVAKSGKQPGDPVKAAKRIVDVVLGRGDLVNDWQFLRLPLGSDGVEQFRGKIAVMQENIELVEKIARSTDF